MLTKKILHTWNYQDMVFVRYEDGMVERVIVDWYFAVDAVNIQKVYSAISTTGCIARYEKSGDYYKVYVPLQEHRSKIVLFLEDQSIPTYEGDLLADKRWYIDNNAEIGSGFRKLYIDIETDDTDRLIEVGKNRILSFGGIDDKGKKIFYILEEETDEAEIKLLKKIAKLLKRYDFFIGWNSSEFDIPYIKERMVKYGLHKTKDFSWKEIGQYDLLKRFRHIFRFDSHIKAFSLDFISKHFLNKGKIPHKEKIIELYRNNKPLLEEYNLEDCVLVKELDDKLGVSNMMIRQSQWCGVPPAKFGLYSIIDSYILKKAHSVGKYCKTSVNAIRDRDKTNETGNLNPNDTDTEKSKYTGAAVLDPKIGKYDKVYTFDFKGLYPSLMRTSNIGYDSIQYEPGRNRITNPGTSSINRKIGGLKPTYFDKQHSVINLAITDLIKKRGEYKDLKLKMIEEGQNRGVEWERVVSDEIIVKELANSTYGIMGLEYGRYYSIDIAESITLFGQWCINFAKAYFEQQGYNVIYGDTDSVFVSTGKDTLDIDLHLKQFHDSLKIILKKDYNIDENFIQLNFDKEYNSFILIAKKTYVGNVINIEGKKVAEMYARGLEYHKKNTFSYAAKKQKELIVKLLSGVGLSEVRQWVSDCRYEFYNKDFTKEELTITQRVGKSVSEYSKTPPLHVRLAQSIKEDTGVDLYRSEVDYVITSNDIKMGGVLSINFDGKFDKDYYWSNKTVPVLERVIDVVYPGADTFNLTMSLF